MGSSDISGRSNYFDRNISMKVIQKAQREIYGGRHGRSQTAQPAKIHLEGLVWSSPIPNDEAEEQFINALVDEMFLKDLYE